MKKLILLPILTVMFFGCTKKRSERSTSTTSDFKFIANWQQDTISSLTYSPPEGDTILTFLNGDTTYITYHGQKLYAFYLHQSGINYNDSQQVYINCFLSPVAFDTAVAWNKTCSIYPNAYWDASSNVWKNQKLKITIGQLYPHFDTASFGIYYHP